MELFHHLQELRSNMTVREKSIAEYPQKGQLQATTRSGTHFSKEFSKLFPFQPPAWHLGHFKGIPGDGNQPPSTPSAQNTPARETCGDTDSATPQLAKIHGMSAEPASQSDVPPSRPWQWEYHFCSDEGLFSWSDHRAEALPKCQIPGQSCRAHLLLLLFEQSTQGPD